MWKLKFVASFALLFAVIGGPDLDGTLIGAAVGAVLGVALLLTEPKTRQSRGFTQSVAVGAGGGHQKSPIGGFTGD